MTKATWEGTVLAESNACVVVEGNYYFPAEAVAHEHLRPSSTTTLCPWKGVAHYYDIEVRGKRNPDAAWYYPEPKDPAKEIKGRIAFWKGVKVDG
jgi:uncharacterized protein (DUF427 family)